MQIFWFSEYKHVLFSDISWLVTPPKNFWIVTRFSAPDFMVCILYIRKKITYLVGVVQLNLLGNDNYASIVHDDGLHLLEISCKVVNYYCNFDY